MSNRFVRASKFRHVWGTANKKEQTFEGWRISRSAWDTNIVKVSPSFLACTWEAGGGGAFAVVPIEAYGRGDNVPLCTGHTAAVLDIDFNPFNDHVIASGAEDCRVMVWKIPEGGLTDNATTPAVLLDGHQRKVGHVLFHPAAEDVLLSTSTDQNINLWDIRKGQLKSTLSGHPDIIASVSWNYDGSLVATTCKDKQMRLCDPRANKIVAECLGHLGIKGSRVAWMGDSDNILTTGFGRTSERQMYVWDRRNMKQAIVQEAIDQSSGILIPFYDNDTKMVYLAGKGDGNIRYYEWVAEDTKLYYLTEYKSATPQRGMGFMPKRACTISDCEVARLYKCTDSLIEPISFKVPRKADTFQADLYPPCPSDQPALTADEYFAGKTANPNLISLEMGYTPSQPRDFVADVSVTVSNVGGLPRMSSFSGPSNSNPGTPSGQGSRSRRVTVSSTQQQTSPLSPTSAMSLAANGTTSTSISAASSYSNTSAIKDAVDDSATLKRENETLKKRNEELEKRVKELEDKLNKLILKK